MDVFPLSGLLDLRAASGGPWLEFVRTADLSAGLYVIEPDGVDGQQPHTEDEVYVILAGRALFTVGTETREVGPGDSIFVAADVPHRFHDIAEELRIVVVFGPAEHTRAQGTARWDAETVEG
ncbi:MAG TPA: cupin domain-containing protein [Candidatus Limnocylindrales bacterium]|jgi:mannose-6-phosphate isomerase-like protein (cupin superfamily)